MSAGKRFLVEQDSKQEMKGRGDVLQKADRSKTQAAGGGGKEKQRYSGRNAG